MALAAPVPLTLSDSFAQSEQCYAVATTLVRSYLVRPPEQRVGFLGEQLPPGVPSEARAQVELLLLGVDMARYQVALVLARYGAAAPAPAARKKAS